VEVRRAGPADVEAIAPLFDAYRQFYELPSDMGVARAYLAERLERGDAIVFMAVDGATVLGFTLLYPTFSSLLPGPILILNDLFVVPEARGRAIGHNLLEQARRHALETGARRIELSTHYDNRRAQRLYESLGYKRDEDFYYYALTV
jgi:ribosomal protein S18 acetylase RimI-like enzyme